MYFVKTKRIPDVYFTIERRFQKATQKLIYPLYKNRYKDYLIQNQKTEKIKNNLFTQTLQTFSNNPPHE